MVSDPCTSESPLLTGLGILGVGFKRFGSEEKLVEDPIHHLYEIYVKINKVITDEAEAEKAKVEAEGKKFEEYNKQVSYYLSAFSSYCSC